MDQYDFAPRFRPKGLPKGMEKLMPIKGEMGLRKVSTDKKLWIYGTPDKFPCHMAAIHVLHTAQDIGAGEIIIVKGPNHKHSFKTVDLVRRVGRWSGPSLLSFQMKPDCFYDEVKKIFYFRHSPSGHGQAEIKPQTVLRKE